MLNTNFQSAHKRLRRLITLTRYEARVRRNLEFDLNIDQLVEILEKQNFQCALTGWDLEFTPGGNFDGRNPRGCTLDRKDNKLGYTVDNVQLVCCIANVIRSKLSLEDFKCLCEAVTAKSNTQVLHFQG